MHAQHKEVFIRVAIINVPQPCSFAAPARQNVSSSFQLRHQLPKSAKPGNSVTGFIANTDLRAAYKLSSIGFSYVKRGVQVESQCAVCSGKCRNRTALSISGGSVA